MLKLPLNVKLVIAPLRSAETTGGIFDTVDEENYFAISLGDYAQTPMCF